MNTTKTPYKPQPDDIVVCDPNFTPEMLADERTPTPIVPARVIEVFKHHVKVEILDEYPNGKRVYTNTDLYGSTCMVLIQTVQKKEI